MKKNQNIIGIVGLGYVGLPLAIEFKRYFRVIGYDSDSKRVNDLKNNKDLTKQFNKTHFIKYSKNILFTNDDTELRNCNFYIIAVPTPVNKKNIPNLSILKKASVIVAKYLKKNDCVIYESTVYPGCTNNFCVPILEKISGLKLNNSFFCGYSPERINPGDRNRTISKIVKITSGSNKKSSILIDNLYKKIIKAGTYKVSSIKVAEAAKVIENVQRDLNIALVNELSLIFNKLQIDTTEVLKAASTKWNFHSYKPGFVGGHCIGVDPYYLTEAAKKANYTANVILAGRKINNQMSKKSIEILLHYIRNKNKKKNLIIKKMKVLILGFSFKENCPDIRNTKIIDLYNHGKKQFQKIDIYDPIVSKSDVSKYYKLSLTKPKKNYYDIIILAVPHEFFIKKKIKWIRSFGKKNVIFFDIKSQFRKNQSNLRL
jgi:UDP-N-acetyl-D-galactosamine dehydrogenase